MALQLVTRAAEVKLMQDLGDVRDRPSGWQAVHFHLTQLMEQYKSEYQLKIAVNLIHDLLKNYQGSIFLLGDSSIILLCYGVEKTIINKLIFQLRYLYMDDPLAYTETGEENPAFCTIYDLRKQMQEFSDLCSRRMTASMRRVSGGGLVEAKALPPEEKPVAKPEAVVRRGDLSASHLAAIEQDLKNADLAKVIRRQPVCAVLPDKSVRRVFDELYIHIAHLRQQLQSEVDFLSNRWLFKYLTQTLDKHMLSLIRRQPARYLGSPVSINLNIETLLSSDFAEFDAALQPSDKVSIVLEVPVVDVFADMAAFLMARREAQKLGYRICLDGLTPKSLASISRDKLGLDLVKVQWNPVVENDLASEESREMAAAVQAAGSNRVILCRCDNRSAVEYGQALGISLFQGRYLDGLLNPTAKVEN